MRVEAARRSGKFAFIDIKESHVNPGRMFISTPNMVELTEKQAINLANAIIDQAEQIWND